VSESVNNIVLLLRAGLAGQGVARATSDGGEATSNVEDVATTARQLSGLIDQIKSRIGNVSQRLDRAAAEDNGNSSEGGEECGRFVPAPRLVSPRKPQRPVSPNRRRAGITGAVPNNEAPARCEDDGMPESAAAADHQRRRRGGPAAAGSRVWR
jgi:hypothetical protein